MKVTTDFFKTLLYKRELFMNTLLNLAKYAFRPFTAFIAVLLWCGLSLADDADLAAVGYYDASGEIQLVEEEFKTHFPNGQTVDEITIRIIDGFVYVARKGYAVDGECFTEVAPLVDRYGAHLTTGSDPAFCSSVYISEFFPVRLVSCKDDGCHALKGVGPIGGPPLVRKAFCDMTEISDNKCRCHIDRGNGLEL
ncbi:MAG TPA: hypothetical protein VFM90_08275, partial [Cyclobacteriaceae bacterium]|nr:hypothetical protein [Cyclobacteriaceae bacterium]